MLIDHELLAASSILVTFITINSLVVAHGGQALISNPPQIVTSLVKAHIMLLSGLDQLRLVHDLTDLLLQQAVWHDP